MANNQLAVYKSFAFGELTEQDVVTIRETIGKDCNESQFKLFMAISKSAGANPVLNEIYPTVRSGQLTVQFGIDFYVRNAKESEGYLGYDVQMVHENDEFKMHQEKGDGERYFIVIDEHSFGFPRGKVIGGYAFAYKQGFKPFSVIMEVDEVEHYKRSGIGMQKTMWTNNFNDMFKKHMVRRALKAAFKLNFSEDDTEVRDSNDIPEYKQERKDITNDAEGYQQQEPSQQEQPQADPEVVDDPIKTAKNQMQYKFKKLGIVGKEAKGEYIKKNIPRASDSPTLAELTGLIKVMDMDIEAMNSTDDDGLE